VVSRATLGWEGVQYPSAFVRSDDGYVVVGSSVGAGEEGDERSGFVAEGDREGELRWRVDAGDRLNDVAVTSTGEYAAVGERDDDPTDHTNDGGLVVRVDADGKVVSARTYPDPDRRGALFYEVLTSVAPTDDGGLILGGQQSRGPWLFEVGPDGEIRWRGGPDGEGRVRDVVRTSDGGYVAAGTLFDMGTGPFVTKWGGETEFTAVYGARLPDFGSVAETGDGYVAAGYGGYVGGEGGYLLGVGTDGSRRWSVAESTSDATFGFDVLGTADGGFIAGGRGSLVKFGPGGTGGAP
jgi:hypothetical protein